MIEKKPRKTRADRQEHQTKYVKAVIADPFKSDRELAKEIGIHHSTVQDIRRDTRHNPPESERLAKLLESDIAIEEKIAMKKLARLNDPEDKINNSDLDRWEQTATKRRQLFTGWPTERVEIAELSPLQLQNVAKELLKASQQ